jgi:hypothetical protein
VPPVQRPLTLLPGLPPTSNEANRRLRKSAAAVGRAANYFYSAASYTSETVGLPPCPPPPPPQTITPLHAHTPVDEKHNSSTVVDSIGGKCKPTSSSNPPFFLSTSLLLLELLYRKVNRRIVHCISPLVLVHFVNYNCLLLLDSL